MDTEMKPFYGGHSKSTISLFFSFSFIQWTPWTLFTMDARFLRVLCFLNSLIPWTLSGNFFTMDTEKVFFHYSLVLVCYHGHRGGHFLPWIQDF